MNIESVEYWHERFEAERDRRYSEVLIEREKALTLARSIEEKFYQERDRRYSEVGQEREKALQIKEKADEAALGLAREIQQYKDEKANQLREQINSERGLYPTKDELIAATEKLEAQIKPLAEYVSSVQGRDRGIGVSWQVALGGLALGALLVKDFLLK